MDFPSGRTSLHSASSELEFLFLHMITIIIAIFFVLVT